MLTFEDKLNISKMTFYDGAQIQSNVFTTIAEYQVTTADKVRFWGYTEEISPTQVLLGKIKAVIKDAESNEVDSDAIVRLVVMNNSKNKTYEVARFRYGDINNTAKDLPVKVPGALPFSYLAVQVALSGGASAFTVSKANSSLDISTTVVQD
ncbi:MAG: hypothetical protein CI947_2141 [Halanaerobium sp.]|nr:MAG: hypothetical protein CI947_2141 [Halanaerobium sp.]